MTTVMSEDEDDGTLRHFVLKREFAEGSIMMSMGKFPAAALPEPGQPAPMVYRYLLTCTPAQMSLRQAAPRVIHWMSGMQQEAVRAWGNVSFRVEKSLRMKTLQSLRVGASPGVACRGDAPWRTRPAIPQYMGEEVAHGGLVTTEPFLKVQPPTAALPPAQFCKFCGTAGGYPMPCQTAHVQGSPSLCAVVKYAPDSALRHHLLLQSERAGSLPLESCRPTPLRMSLAQAVAYPGVR